MELPEIIRDDHYDFNFQASRYELECMIRSLIVHRMTVLDVKLVLLIMDT